MGYKCPEDDIIVTICDVDSEKISSWKSDNIILILFKRVTKIKYIKIIRFNALKMKIIH